MAEIVCRTCGTNDGTHERWCAVGHRVAEIAAKDRRIAELEAALAVAKRHVKHIADGSDYETCIDRCPACACDMPLPALAAAKREALEEGARRYEVEGLMPYSGTQVAEFLRRMAREVKP